MILRFTAAVGILVAFAMAFFTLRTIDELAPRGTTAVITIWDLGETLPRPDARPAIVAAAARHDATLYHSTTQATGTHIVRTLSTMNIGTPRGLDAPSVRYPDFSSGVRTHFAGGPDLPDSQLSGMYVTDASIEAADAIVRTLSEQGVVATVRPISPMTIGMWVAGHTPVIPLLAAALTVLVGGLTHWAGRRRHEDAIALTSGAHRMTTALRHVGTALATILLFVAAGLVGSLPALAAYNHLAQWGRFAVMALVASATVAAISAALLLIVCSWGRRDPLVVVNGGGTLRREAVVSTVLRGAALVLLIVITGQTIAAGGLIRENRTEQRRWDAAPDVVALWYTASSADLDRTQSEFDLLISRLSASDSVIVAAHPPIVTDGFGPDHGNSITANGRYLDEQTILRADGHRVRRADLRADRLSLLIPTDVSVPTATVQRDWQRWAEFQRGSTDRDPVGVDIIRTQPDQLVFNYAATPSDETSLQRSPVVAVLPASARLVSENWMVASSTTGEVVFTDPRALRSELRATGLDQYVGETPVLRERALARLADQRRELAAAFFVGIVALFTTGIGTVIGARVRVERSRCVSFARMTNGGGPGPADVLTWTIPPAVALATSLAAGFIAPPAIGPAACVTGIETAIFIGLVVASRARHRSPEGS